MENIEIKYLHDCQEHIPALAEIWYEGIRRQWVPNSSVVKTIEDLKTHAQIHDMPLAVVALMNNQPVGLACLRDDDGLSNHLTPWLGSLAVHPNFQRRDIGAHLITHIKTLAKARHFESLYLLAFDPTIPTWYATLGWETIGNDTMLGHPITVMRIRL